MSNFFQKPAKGKMATLFLVFLWIAIWNIIYQAFHGKLNEMGIEVVNWAFFMSSTVFFMLEELSFSGKFWSTLIGGAVGLLLAAGFVVGHELLVEMGLNSLAAVCIVLVVAVGILILAKPYMPIVFNNVGFCYFIIALINPSTAVSMLPKYLYSLVLGSVFLNLGCIAILKIYMKCKKKKASAAAAEQAAVNS